MSYDAYLLHLYTHTIPMAYSHHPACEDCLWCYPGETLSFAPKVEEDAPWRVIEHITIRKPARLRRKKKS